jgi:hypothetical protein
MRLLLLWSTMATLLGAGSADRVAAQTGNRENGHGTRVAVTLAQSEGALDGRARFLIIRTPGNARPDIILLPADSDENDFSEAVRSLLITRRRSGDEPVENAMLRSPGARQVRERSSELPWATRVLRDLRIAPMRRIQSVGTVRALEIWLPRQSRDQPG